MNANHNGAFDRSSPSVVTQQTVTFDLAIEFHAALALSDFSEEERCAYWYSEQDLSEIQSEVASILELMDSNTFIEDEDNCTRGLESRTRRSMETLAKSKAIVLEAISREYFLLKHYGENAEGVRCICWEIYVRDEESARLRAMMDEEEAFRIFLEDSIDMLRGSSAITFDIDYLDGCSFDECDEDLVSLSPPTSSDKLARHLFTSANL